MSFEDVTDGLEAETGTAEVLALFNLTGLSLVPLVEVCMDTLKVVPIKRFGVEALSRELASEVSDIERTGMIENPMFPVCLEFTSMEAEIRP